MDQESTTNLAIIRTNPELFTWGTVVAIHNLDRYTFVEFEAYTQPGERGYQIYVDENDIQQHCKSLQSAMVLAIAFHNVKPSQRDYTVKACCQLLEIRLW